MVAQPTASLRSAWLTLRGVDEFLMGSSELPR
jgi:hypothetical protein